jgi:hypothetical protein
VSSGTCTTVTYTLSKTDLSAYDSTVFTFTPATPSLSVYTTSSSKVAYYTLLLTGTLTGDTISASTSFIIHVNSVANPCSG